MRMRAIHGLLQICVTMLVLACAGAGFGGTVRTLDGKTFEGRLELLPDEQLLVALKGGGAVKLALDDVIEADFHDADDASRTSRLPAPWMARDIGRGDPPGKTVWFDQSFTLSTGASGPAPHRDAFHFALQPLFGDGEIIARLADLKGATAMGGVMFRDSVDPDSPFVMIGVSPKGVFAGQRTQGKKTARIWRLTDAGVPVWLKITRKGARFELELSVDGQSWGRLAQFDASLGDTVGAGVFAAAGKPGNLAAVTFDHVQVRGRRTRDVADANADDAAARTRPELPRGVQMVNGLILAGEVRTANADSVTLMRNGQEAVLPTARVARIIFSDLDARMMAALVDAPAGVLLRKDDYFQGALRNLVGGRLTVSSVLFGLRTFAVPQEALAMTVQPPRPPTSRLTIRAADGTVAHADKLIVSAADLKMDDEQLGSMTVPRTVLRLIRVNSPRLVHLESLLDRSARGNGLRASISPQGTNWLTLAAGKTWAFDVDGTCTRLLARIAVPSDLPPTVHVRCVVRVDGKTAFESKEMISADDPLLVDVDLSSARALEIRVESPDGSANASVRLIDPVVVKK